MKIVELDAEWLMDKFNLDLSLVARLGGHLALQNPPRQGAFSGRDLHLCLDSDGREDCGELDKARIITKARATELIMSGGACTGCVHEKGGASFKEFGPVILASGGFGADFTQNSLLATYRPDLFAPSHHEW